MHEKSLQSIKFLEYKEKVRKLEEFVKLLASRDTVSDLSIKLSRFNLQACALES